MRPAGIRGDVASDLGLLAGTGVGREQEAVLAGEPTDVCGRHPRLDPHPPQQRLDRPHAGETLEPEHDSPVERDGAAREARPAAARDQRDIVLVAPRQCPRDLVGRRRQDDRVRATPDSAALGLVAEIGRDPVDEDALAREDRAEIALERRRRHVSF